MADTTLVARGLATGLTLDTRIENEEDLIWNGEAYVELVVDDIASYATPTPESPAGSRRYICQFPVTSPPGYYTWSTHQWIGEGPTIDDPVVATGTGYWDGTTFGNVPGVPAIQATLDSYGDLVASGSVDDPSPSATTFLCSPDTGLSDDPNVYRTLSVCFTDGDLKAAKSVISSWNGTTKRVVVAGFAKPPANGDHFKVI